MQRTLIHFTHGLGDAVQLTCIFQHLQKYRADWELYLQAQRDKQSAGQGYCKRVRHDQEAGPGVAGSPKKPRHFLHNRVMCRSMSRTEIMPTGWPSLTTGKWR